MYARRRLREFACQLISLERRPLIYLNDGDFGGITFSGVFSFSHCTRPTIVLYAPRPYITLFSLAFHKYHSNVVYATLTVTYYLYGAGSCLVPDHCYLRFKRANYRIPLRASSNRFVRIVLLSLPERFTDSTRTAQ